MAHMAVNLIHWFGEETKLVEFVTKINESAERYDAFILAKAEHIQTEEWEPIDEEDELFTMMGSASMHETVPFRDVLMLQTQHETRWKQHDADNLVVIADKYGLKFINCYEEGMAFYGAEIYVDGKLTNIELSSIDISAIYTPEEGMDGMTAYLQKKIPEHLLEYKEYII